MKGMIPLCRLSHWWMGHISQSDLSTGTTHDVLAQMTTMMAKNPTARMFLHCHTPMDRTTTTYRFINLSLHHNHVIYRQN